MSETSVPERPVRIVVCAESRNRLVALAACLDGDAELLVVDRCHGYEQLIRSLPRTTPHLIAIELALLGPSVDDAARRIERAKPARVVVLAPALERRSERGRAAMAAGAVAIVSDSAVDFDLPDSAWARAFRSQFKRFASAPPAVSRRHRPRPAPSFHRAHRCRVIGICASTGGPPALEAVLSRLPGDFPIPILVVQHMIPGFTLGLATWLDERIELPVALAPDGHDLEPGVWFAADGSHLVLDARRRLVFDPRPPFHLHRPSADLLLSSLADVDGAGAAAVVLTGMGRDGADGLAAVDAAGGITIAQDERSSAVYGMPRAAAELGASLILPPRAIGDELASLAARVPS